MSQPTVLIYGSAEHAGLSLIHESLAERSNCRAVFVVQEAFFSNCRLFMGTDPSESMLYLTESDAAGFTDVTSVCMDSFYISPAYLDGFNQEDITYIQTEGWSALIAMFDQLGRNALMANFITERDHVATRWSRLCCLAGAGLKTPNALVTSDPSELQRFREQHGEVVYKMVADPSESFTKLEGDALNNFERLPMAPVHFEEAPEGVHSSLTLIGPKAVQLPQEAPTPPEDLVIGCQELAEKLGLTLAEFGLLRRPNGEWLVTGFQCFPSAAVLAVPEVLATVSLLLETGRA